MNFLTNSLTNCLLKCELNSMKEFVRYFERRKFIRRFGFVQHSHHRGLLPRVKGEVCPLPCVPHERKPDEWRPKSALFGQNDYIDILGDGSISVTQLMTETPHWLKNFRGNEMQMSIRKRSAYRYWKWCRPKKWTQLNNRINSLYRLLNYKRKPRNPLYPPNY